MGNITHDGSAAAGSSSTKTDTTNRATSPENGAPTAAPVPVEVSRLRSADFSKLAGALAKAQLRIGNAEKNAENPHFKKPYADMASIREAFRLPLAENEIAFSQIVSTNARGEMVVTTMLLHVSGQFLEGSIRFKADDNNPQVTGSKLTYMKRYAAAAITGVAASDDDDDGEGAQGRGQPPAQRGRNEPQQRQRADARQAPVQQASRQAESAKVATASTQPSADDENDPAQLATLKLAWEDRMARADNTEAIKAVAAEISKGPFAKGSEEWTALLATYAKEMKRVDPTWKPTSGRK